MVDPGDWLPLLGMGLGIVTTLVSIVGAYAMGRGRGFREGMLRRAEEGETRDQIHQMQRSLESVAEEIERLGEVQRFALKVIAEKAVASEPPRIIAGRPITPH